MVKWPNREKKTVSFQSVDEGQQLVQNLSECVKKSIRDKILMYHHF